MLLRPDELDAHLRDRLAPVYLLAGEEPLFVQEGLDAVRAAARAAGFVEREVLDVGSGFDWSELDAVAGAMSLFGDRKVVELRMPTGKPGTAGSKTLTAYCKAPSPDVILLISCGALDGSQRRSAWVKAIEKGGVACYAWPLPVAKLPQWLTRRLRAAGLTAEPAALEMLVERAEGNLLAAAQEIEKLRLLNEQGPIGVEQVRAAVADSARFDVFVLADAAVAGHVARCARIVRGLRAEGTEPILALWALARDLRALVALSGALAAGRDPAPVLRQHGVLSSRRGLLQQAARQRGPTVWMRLLERCARADRILKGVAPGRPWDELLQLSTSYAAQLARR